MIKSCELILMLFLSSFVGCSYTPIAKPRVDVNSPPRGTDETEQRDAEDGHEDADADAEESGDEESDADEEDDGNEREVARRGVGKRGRGYGGGIISEPARLYWGLRERVVFEMNIPKALKEYKALDPDGVGPQSHEEFMELIIGDSGIDLPELPEGDRYVYDPEQEQLMVERTSSEDESEDG